MVNVFIFVDWGGNCWLDHLHIIKKTSFLNAWLISRLDTNRLSRDAASASFWWETKSFGIPNIFRVSSGNVTARTRQTDLKLWVIFRLLRSCLRKSLERFGRLAIAFCQSRSTSWGSPDKLHLTVGNLLLWIRWFAATLTRSLLDSSGGRSCYMSLIQEIQEHKMLVAVPQNMFWHFVQSFAARLNGVHSGTPFFTFK